MYKYYTHIIRARMQLLRMKKTSEIDICNVLRRKMISKLLTNVYEINFFHT